MVRIYRATDSEKIARAGYDARYIADLTFMQSLNSCGVIIVDIESTARSSPHSHSLLEEVFIAVTEIQLYIGDTCYNLNEGDVIIVEPGELHSFQTKTNKSARIIALKFPNIKDDKVVPTKGSDD